MKLELHWMHTCPVLQRRVTTLCSLNGTANGCNQRNMEAAKRLMELTCQSCSSAGTWINTWFNLLELRLQFTLQVTSNRQQGAQAITTAGEHPAQWSQTSQYCIIHMGSSTSTHSDLFGFPVCPLGGRTRYHVLSWYLPSHCSKRPSLSRQCWSGQNETNQRLTQNVSQLLL